VIRTGRDRGSGLLGSQPQPVIPASVIPEELITQVPTAQHVCVCVYKKICIKKTILKQILQLMAHIYLIICFKKWLLLPPPPPLPQAQVVLQGKSRSVIIRELQRTNLDVNLAVNNLLSRDDEDGDDGDDTASESYLPGGMSNKKTRQRTTAYMLLLS